MHDSEFAGRLDFNQRARKHDCFDVLLEVQSPVTPRDKHIICPGALNSKALFPHMLFGRCVSLITPDA